MNAAGVVTDDRLGVEATPHSRGHAQLLLTQLVGRRGAGFLGDRMAQSLTSADHGAA